MKNKKNKEILHKKGCYSRYYDDNGRCLKCKVLFPKYAKERMGKQ